MLAGTGGHVMGLQGEDVRINDRFFVGGRTFRGFNNAGIGPRDKNTHDALGGNAYYVGTAEVTFPIGLPEDLGFRGAIFTDAGSLFSLDTSGSDVFDDSALRASYGMGVLWRSPFGPIRLDFAKAFKKQSYDETEIFRFNFGTAF
jgi:outer membrane protein insertion porin family